MAVKVRVSLWRQSTAICKLVFLSFIFYYIYLLRTAENIGIAGLLGAKIVEYLDT